MKRKNFIHFDFMLQGFLQVSVIFVCFYVTVTLWWLDKLLVTLKTFIWHFPRVNPFVRFHRAALWKRFAAVGTMKWHISCVISCVYLEFFLLLESFEQMLTQENWKAHNIIVDFHNFKAIFQALCALLCENRFKNRIPQTRVGYN